MLPLVILLGMIGNILIFIVLIRKQMRNMSVNVYLLLLACKDTGVLYFSRFKAWLHIITDFELLHMSNASCKCLMFFFLISLHMSAWLVVTISADSFTAVWFPLRSLTVCNVRSSNCQCNWIHYHFIVQYSCLLDDAFTSKESWAL